MRSELARLQPVLLPLLFGVVALGAWQAAVVASGTAVFPTPLAVVRGIGELGQRGVLLRYVLDSLFRVSAGFGLALLPGIPLGLVMGSYPRVAVALGPVIQVLRPISPIAWIPLSIVFFGITNAATIFLVFLASFFPIVLAAMSGVRSVPEIYVRAGRNFGLSPLTLFYKVVFPAALPQILTGLRLALGVAWLVLVAAEMIAVDSGLGYLILDARNAGKRTDLVVAGMALIGAIGLVLDLLLRGIERLPSVRWGFSRGRAQSQEDWR